MFTTILFISVAGFLLKRKANAFDSKAEQIWRSTETDFTYEKPASWYAGEFARFIVVKNQATIRYVIGEVLQIIAVVLILLVGWHTWYAGRLSDWREWLF